MQETQELRAVVVDDEPHGVKMLVNFLHNYCENVTVVATASNATEARTALAATNPDVLFLDINMPNENGFDVLASIEQRTFQVVFVTAYQEYAIKAIKAGALDYLLKPVDIDELRACIERIKTERTANYSESDKSKQVSIVMQTLAANTKTLGKIAVPTTNGFEFIPTNHIIRCESDNTYTTFFLHDGKKILVCKPIKEYEGLLEGSGFMRVHRSHLVNLAHVHQVHRTDGWHIITTDNARVEIARRRVEDVLAQLNIQ